MKEKILTVGNWIFLPVDQWGECVVPHETKYVSVSRSGRADLSNIYTFEEIIAKFPDVQTHEYLTCFQVWTSHQ